MFSDFIASVPVPGVTPGTPQATWIVTALIVTTIVAPTWAAWWNARVAKKQVTPNGGSSLKDQVSKMVVTTDRVEVKVDLAATKVELANSRIEKHDGQIEAINRKLDSLMVASTRTREQVVGYVQGIKTDVSDLHKAQEQRRETVESETEQ